MSLRLALTVALTGLVAPVSVADAATFLFIRHAESTINSGAASTPEEILDPPLTALGQQQAQDLVGVLKDLDLTHIYVSSYQRTTLTIEPTAAEFGLPPLVESEIREWSFGDGSAGLDYNAINDMFDEQASGNTAARIAGVDDPESLDELVERVVPAYRAIIEAHKDEDGVVAIVGHGGSIGWVMPYFAENVTLDVVLSNNLRNTGIVEVRLDSAGRPMVADWDGIAFEVETQAPVPLPASGLLLLAGLGGIAALRRRARAA